MGGSSIAPISNRECEQAIRDLRTVFGIEEFRVVAYAELIMEEEEDELVAASGHDMELYKRQFEEIQRRLTQPNSSEADSFKGATSEEIAELEEYAGGKFPLAYRTFLQTMGKSAGRLFQGSHALISQRWSLRYRDFAQEMLSKHGGDELPEPTFVFLMHQGYQFLFFRLDEGDDPPIYIVTDSEPEPKLLSESFTTYIDRYVTSLEELAATRAVR